MKRYLLLLSAVLLVAVPAAAQTTIGVYFDEEGTSLYGFAGTLPEAATCYILVDGMEDLLSGAAFTVDIDPRVTAFPPSWPLGSTALGDLASGVEIGLENPVPVFAGQKGLLGSFTVIADYNIDDAMFTVGTHPQYATPVVANNQALQSEALGLTSYLKIHAIPTVCVYFDEAGTQTDTAYLPQTLLEAHVMVRDAEMLMQGVALKLDALDPVFTLLGTTYADGVQQGDLYNGLELGLYAPVPVFGDDVGLIATMSLIVSENATPVQAQFEIVPHPDYDDVMVSDQTAYQYPANTCGVSTVDVPIPNEDVTWGALKTLYR